jgi:hypothetical protein
LHHQATSARKSSPSKEKWDGRARCSAER